MPKQHQSKRLSIALAGATGKLGRLISNLCNTDFSNQAHIKTEVSSKNSGEFLKKIPQVDVILDVSTAAFSVACVKALLGLELKIPLVVGVTGHSDKELKIIQKYSELAPVIAAPNFSPGVALLREAIQAVAPRLHALGYQAVLNEIHHDQKRDAPSGTALAILSQLDRKSKPQVHCSRVGQIVGTHELQFFGPRDILSLRHEALDRSIFAEGAIYAALWAAKKREAGYFSMRDVFIWDESTYDKNVQNPSRKL